MHKTGLILPVSHLEMVGRGSVQCKRSSVDLFYSNSSEKLEAETSKAQTSSTVQSQSSTGQTSSTARTSSTGQSQSSAGQTSSTGQSQFSTGQTSSTGQSQSSTGQSQSSTAQTSSSGTRLGGLPLRGGPKRRHSVLGNTYLVPRVDRGSSQGFGYPLLAAVRWRKKRGMRVLLSNPLKLLITPKPLEGKPATFSQKSVMAKAGGTQRQYAGKEI
ncbi:hypothetical protein DPX16_11605 [Anabarilius grahami]|uniref:Uncharacterized protein n=1 Tax=Anabarilius grahami TaxID=495550 RepID=A0A3N0YJ32_ANAGA|nr:hypothetical protein DPX16_11605 [Anabarilius grahami]